MERRAIVIRTMGNPEIAGAIVDGMTKNVIPLDVKELKAVRAELTRLRAREGVRKNREDRDWHDVQMSLERQYGVRQHGVVYDRIIVAWALTCLFVTECYRRLSAWRCQR